MSHDKISPADNSNLAAALEAAHAGCRVFPCNPRDKTPLCKWTELATSEPEQIRAMWKKHPKAMPAIATGSSSGFAVIDLDVKKGKDGVTAYKRLGLDPNDAGAVVRTASGGLHLYFDHRDGVRNAVDKLAPGIDVRGERGYVIAPGASGEVGTYRLTSGSLDVARMFGLELPKQFWPLSPVAADRSVDLPEATPEVIRSALFYIPNDENYEDWVKILMAVHHGYEGATEGLDLIQEWCAGYPDYNANEVAKKWRTFEVGKAGAVTVGTLFAEAREHGWDGRGVSAGTNLSTRIHPSIRELNDTFAFVRMGAKVAIAECKSNGDIEFMATSAFREFFSNRRHGFKTLGNAWIMHSKRRSYGGGVVFRPNGTVQDDTLNLWTGWATEPDPDGDCSMILGHIREVIASGNEEHFNYIVSWLAHIVQTPAEKPDVALVLKGKKGVGKDTLAEIMKSIVGRRHYAHVPATERLTARFNAPFATAVLIHVEEAIWGGQKESKGVVQSLITCPEMPLERKNIDTVQIDSFCRLLFTTNEAWAVPATADERRYAVFEVSPERRNEQEYFAALYHQIQNGGCSAFLHFLLNWEQPKEIKLRNAPRTTGLLEQKLSGLRGVERWWYEVLCDGDFPVGDGALDDESWDSVPKSARRDALRQAYQEWMSHRRYQGEIVGPSEFGTLLKSLCQGMESRRPQENGERVRKYTFPPAKECRVAFAKYMSGDDEGIDWPD